MYRPPIFYPGTHLYLCTVDDDVLHAAASPFDEAEGRIRPVPSPPPSPHTD